MVKESYKLRVESFKLRRIKTDLKIKSARFLIARFDLILVEALLIDLHHHTNILV